MKRTLILPNLNGFPARFHPLLKTASVYDSSCSPEARVWFLDKDGGFFLKTAPRGTLEREAAMNRFYHGKGLGPEVLDYLSLEQDWMLTRRLPGEDCLSFLDDPVRLCDTTASLLRILHETDSTACPVANRTGEYLAAARKNYGAGVWDMTLFPDNWGYATPEEAWAIVESQGKFLKTDTLLHGDYCLPNILLDNWKFSGFLDLGAGGVGDRHVDLFWGIWTLQFNLKTNRYRDRFLDAYGRDKVTEELLRVVAAAEVFL